MAIRLTDLNKRLFHRTTKPRTPALRVESLEDRVVPTAEVTVAFLADTVEGGPSPGAFRFSRTGDTSGELTVSYTVAGAATPGSDYAALSGSVTFAPNAATADVNVSPEDDSVAEYDESVSVTVEEGTGYTVGEFDSAAVVIADNEQPVVMVEKIYDPFEGLVPGWFAVSRRGDTSQSLAINIAVSGTATSGTDYTPIGTPVTLAAGESAAYLEVAALDEGVYDPNETVVVTIQSGTGYTIDTQNSASVSIRDGQQPSGPNAPVANNDSYTIIHDRLLIVEVDDGLLANDTDPDDDPVEVIIVSQPSNGTFTFQTGAAPYGAGGFRYLPDPGFVGTDSFKYVISDGTHESNAATVTITVTNAIPAALPDQYTIYEDQVLQVGGSGGGLPPPGGGGGGEGVLVNDTDSDDDILRTQLVSDVSSGSLVFRDDGTFIYTPVPNFAGTVTFTYSTTDGVVSTSPVTVTITVQSGGPFDLDGHDGATLTTWMSEPDEAAYGLGVSVGHDGEIFTRVYNKPSNMVITRRRVYFDPNVLSVGGVTYPGYIELSPGGGNEVLTVSALVTGYNSTGITYEIMGEITGGEFGELFATLCMMPVVEEKAVLRELEFTSDHNVIRENTKDSTKSGLRYPDVEFVRAKKVNAPMSQTVNLPGAPSKMKVKVTWDWAGIAAGVPFKLVGTSADTALAFESAVFLTNAAGASTLELTATNTVGDDIRTINAAIDWKMVLNPGAANEKTLPMGVSGAHKIYVLFGTPVAQNREPFQATDIRLDRVVDVGAQAVANARAAVAPAGPKWQRIAFEVVQLQKFNLFKNIVEAPLFDAKDGAMMIPNGDKKLANAWTVYDTWGLMPTPGADCISGAAFSWLVIATGGMPGFHNADAFAPKDATKPTTAVSFVQRDPARERVTAAHPGKLQVLNLIDGGGNPNQFEATLIYTPPGAGATTFFFPVGAGPARFTKADDVLTVFGKASWILTTNGAEVEVVHRYKAAPNANID
jgi:hypothetical protein